MPTLVSNAFLNIQFVKFVRISFLFKYANLGLKLDRNYFSYLSGRRWAVVVNFANAIGHNIMQVQGITGTLTEISR